MRFSNLLWKFCWLCQWRRIWRFFPTGIESIGDGKMVKCVFVPTRIESIGDDEMVKYAFVPTGIESIGDIVSLVVFKPIGVQPKFG